MSTWAPDGVPFCWMPKEALRRIEQKLDPSKAAGAKLLYLALTRIASDVESANFQKPISYVAALASVNRRTVERRLPDLERLGLVTVKRGALRVSHEYSVTTLSRNVATPSPSVATKHATHSRTYRRTEESTADTSTMPTLTTAQRIGLEHKAELLKGKIRKLEDDTHYPQDRTPERMSDLNSFRTQLTQTEQALLR
jgi:DNA-binding transcriptional regulator YhcF (GntR family)